MGAAAAGRTGPNTRTSRGTDGSGSHRSLQAAIDAVPQRSRQCQSRVLIQLRPGVYRERVCVPAGKAPITLLGDAADASAVLIVGSAYGGQAKRAGVDSAHPLPPRPGAAHPGYAGQRHDDRRRRRLPGRAFDSGQRRAGTGAPGRGLPARRQRERRRTRRGADRAGRPRATGTGASHRPPGHAARPPPQAGRAGANLRARQPDRRRRRLHLRQRHAGHRRQHDPEPRRPAPPAQWRACAGAEHTGRRGPGLSGDAQPLAGRARHAAGQRQPRAAPGTRVWRGAPGSRACRPTARP
jgi:hypothetical protein